MGKRLWAIWIKQMLISLAIVASAGIATNYFSYEADERNLLFSAFGAIALYFVLIAGLGIIHILADALYLWLFSGNDLSAAVLDDLRAAGLPAPRSVDTKTYDYLANLADDGDAKAEDRVRAAMLYGSYQMAMSKGLFRSLILRRAIDDAVLRYYQEAPQRT